MKRRRPSVEEHPKGSGRYRVRTRVGGKNRIIAKGLPLADANEQARRYEAGLPEPATDGPTLGTLGEAFLARRDRRGIRGIKQEGHRWSLMITRDPIGSVPVRELERADFLDWLDRWSSKDVQTRRNALNLVRKALDEARDRGLCEGNVARDVKVERAGRASTEEELGGVLWPHEQEALLEAVPAGIEREAVAFALYGGLRQGSQWALTVEDAELVPVLLRQHKSGRPRRLHLIPKARAALDRAIVLARAAGSPFAFPAPRGGRRHYGHKPAGWASWLAKAGIKRRVRWHDLRHTCATALLAGWWTPRAWTLNNVCSYLHHSSIKVTERYARFLEETQLQAIAEMSAPSDASQAAPPASDEVPESSGRRGSDSNRRVTVLQSGGEPSDVAGLPDPPAPLASQVAMPALEALAMAASAVRGRRRVHWVKVAPARKGAKRDAG